MKVERKILLISIFICFLMVLIPSKSYAESIKIKCIENGYVKSRTFDVEVKSKDYKYIVLWDCETQKKIKSWVNPSKNKGGDYKNTWDKYGTKKITVPSDGSYRIGIYNDIKYISYYKFNGPSTEEGRLTRITFTVDTTAPKISFFQSDNTKLEEKYMKDTYYISIGDARIVIQDSALKEVKYHRCGYMYENDIKKETVKNNKVEFCMTDEGEYEITAKDKIGNEITEKLIIGEKQKYVFSDKIKGNDLYTDEYLIALTIHREFCIESAHKYFDLDVVEAWKGGLSVGYCAVNRAINNHCGYNFKKKYGASDLAKQLYYPRQYVSRAEISKCKKPCETCIEAAKIITKFNSTIVTEPNGDVMNNQVSEQSSFGVVLEDAELWWAIKLPRQEDEFICICHCIQCERANPKNE